MSRGPAQASFQAKQVLGATSDPSSRCLTMNTRDSKQRARVNQMSQELQSHLDQLQIHVDQWVDSYGVWKEKSIRFTWR